MSTLIAFFDVTSKGGSAAVANGVEDSLLLGGDGLWVFSEVLICELPKDVRHFEWRLRLHFFFVFFAFLVPVVFLARVFLVAAFFLVRLAFFLSGEAFFVSLAALSLSESRGLFVAQTFFVDTWVYFKCSAEHFVYCVQTPAMRSGRCRAA